MRAALLLILGAIILAAGVWLISSVGFTPLAIVAALVTALGGSLVVAGIGGFLDSAAPTRKKI
ncbi:hypothetical protein [Corynebacterium tapiri]|uniref:Uncharacterized protein n=1 Tax=Corynebacterium tapiri TaxID=1448266 RepID=A0A5C4U414_9CORY|nr:hypothetical protein [Corynebacterium tapiri]TNL98463.1 hypothetical protein FHE74_04485 [Corynebacterium tapiri]